MGKRSRNSDGQDAGSRSDLKRCRRALRSLDLVDSRLDVESWGEQVSRYVGEDDVNQWFELGTELNESYDFSYSSFERAMHFSVGWRSWPLAAEIEWMLPRLRDAITRAGADEPFLVEIGTGAGAAAAVISAALKVPVVAIDSHPKTLGLAEQFASRTGGTVESRVADIADLVHVLEGAVPAAVFGMTVYRYLQPHEHTRDSFSDWQDMQEILTTYQVGSRVESFIKALGGADLVVAEVMCTDYLAEMAAGLFKFGYEIPQGGIKRIEGATPNGPTRAFGIHFSTADLPKRNPNLLIEMFSPLPRPYAGYVSDSDNDPEAEALRLSLEPTDFINAAEVDYTDGSGRLRHEIFGWDTHLVGQYVATTRGYRSLQFYPRNQLDAVIQAVHDDEAAIEEAGKATIRPVNLAATQWGSPVDRM